MISAWDESEKLNVTYEQVGQLRVEVTEIKNSTDYIKRKTTDYDEKQYLLDKKGKGQ